MVVALTVVPDVVDPHRMVVALQTKSFAGGKTGAAQLLDIVNVPVVVLPGK